MNEIVSRAAVPSLLLDPTRFETAQRAGRMMALSALFPQHLRSGSHETAVANAVLVMNIADRMREDPLAVAQNIYFVGGKPGWNASYMISRANQSGVFKGPIRWRFEGQGDDLIVTAWAKMADTGDEVNAAATMAMARAENWTKNPKYASMPRQMLQYRSATFLIRLYCPEVMLGYQTAEELEDVRAASGMIDVTPKQRPDETPAPEPEVADQAPKAKGPGPSGKTADSKQPQKEGRASGATRESAVVEGKAEPADEKPKGKPEPEVETADEEAELPEMLQSVYDRIIADLRDADMPAHVDQIAAMFSDQIEAIGGVSTDHHARIEQAISDAHERVSLTDEGDQDDGSKG